MAKVLIIYASFGEGHKKGAYALSEVINSPCKDLLDFSHPLIKKIYALSYIIITQYFPHFWQAAFFLAGKKSFFSLVNAGHKRIFSSFLKYLKETKPAVIIATHFFPLHLGAIVRDELNIKLISIITDLRVHPLWVNRHIDYYFAALDITKDDLFKLGVEEKKVITGFVPLRKGFLKEFSKGLLREKFNLDSKPVIIFISSLRGKLPFFKESIDIFLGDFNIFVIYGRNKKLGRYLKNKNSVHIQPFFFHEEIWELISLSSVIITKPGGLTVFEGIYKKKPFIFTHYIPGQEKENMDLLTGRGVAKFVRNRDELIKAVYYFEKKSGELSENYPLEIKDINQPLNDLVQNRLGINF